MKTVRRLSYSIMDRLALGELGEVCALELIRAAARLRGLNRAERRAEWEMELALESFLDTRQELAKFGHTIPRLYTVGAPEQLDADRELYSSLPRGAPFRLDGKIVLKDAA
jgi:hypothetical protein